MYAVYKGNIYKCSTVQGGKIIKLLSETNVKGFTKGIVSYYLQVSREECDRVFKREQCFRYIDESYLVKEEKEDKVLLETGPRGYDLSALGFTRVLNDVFQKWAPKSEGEYYWNETDY